jgi:hypothetical protein
MYALLIEPLAPWKFWIDVCSAGTAFLAGNFWPRASLVRGPKEVRHAFHAPLEGPLKGYLPEAVEAMEKQSRLNARAAAFAALNGRVDRYQHCDRLALGIAE